MVSGIVCFYVQENNDSMFTVVKGFINYVRNTFPGSVSLPFASCAVFLGWSRNTVPKTFRLGKVMFPRIATGKRLGETGIGAFDARGLICDTSRDIARLPRLLQSQNAPVCSTSKCADQWHFGSVAATTSPCPSAIPPNNGRDSEKLTA